MRARAAALLLILAVACKRPAPPPPKPAQQPATKAAPANNLDVDVDLDGDNLLNLAYGASVVSRTGESNLEVSAMQAIDGLATTFWSSPPGDPRQTLVFALPTRSRVERIGITTYEQNYPKKIRFDASLDGRKWTEVATRNYAASIETQIAPIEPFEARYLRVEILEPETGYAFIRSLHAIGHELEPPPLRNFDGCWTINGFPARLEQKGARITGVIASEPPIFLDGGTDGHVAMFTWTHGPNHGYATVSMDPATQTISGLTMYEEISIAYAAGAWLGKRCTASPSAVLPTAPRAPTRQWPMYGLAFDANDQLIENLSQSTLDEAAARIAAAPAERFRIVAHELRFNDADRRTTARIASIRTALAKRNVDLRRVEFIAAGKHWGEPAIITAIQRLMASRVDLELVRAAR